MFSWIFENSTLAVLALILGFGFLIFVHELGHFAVAKWVGIRATQFAIGFGNAIVAYRKGLGVRFGSTEKEYLTRSLDALREDGVDLEALNEHARNQRIMEKADALGLGETEYRLNTLPLGGYVKMLGQEDMDPAAQSDDPRSFNRKSVGARAAVISAGVIMNLIFGLIFFMICFQMGVKFPAAVVGGVAPLSPAATTYAEGFEGDPRYLGLRVGDRITATDGNPIEDFTGVKIATALGKADRAVALTVQREGEAEPLTYRVVARPDRRQEGLLSAGILPAPTLRVVTVLEDTPFADAGAKAGMTITAVDGEPVETYGQYAAAFDRAGGRPVTVTLTRDGETVRAEVQPQPAFRTAVEQRQLLGITPATRIPSVAADSPAEDAGVQPGDLIARVGEVDWPDLQETMDAIRGSGRGGVRLVVMRDGQNVDLGTLEPEGGILGIGLEPLLDESRIGRVLESSPLASANLPGGSEILSVRGEAVGNWTDLQRALSSIAPEDTAVPIEARINLGDQPTETFDVAVAAEDLARVRHAGWAPPMNLGLDDLMVELKANGPVESAVLGAVKTKEFVQQTYITLLRLFQGSIGVKNLRGPVGIVDEGSKIASRGFAYYLFFLGLISVNLAVLNFLPIPIVDGGLMVFLLIEKLKGSPASPKVQVAVSLVGLVGLACIFLYVTFNDISRLVSG
jgi:regulator of sigma E protease